MKTSAPASGKDVPFCGENKEKKKRIVIQIRSQWGKLIPGGPICFISKRNVAHAFISTLPILCASRANIVPLETQCVKQNKAVVPAVPSRKEKGAGCCCAGHRLFLHFGSGCMRLGPVCGLTGFLGTGDPQVAVSSLGRSQVHPLDCGRACSHTTWPHSCPPAPALTC